MVDLASAITFHARGSTEALDLEWAADGIRVVDLWPRFVGAGKLRARARAPPPEWRGTELSPAEPRFREVGPRPGLGYSGGRHSVVHGRFPGLTPPPPETRGSRCDPSR